jgi:hypothetical protein
MRNNYEVTYVVRKPRATHYVAQVMQLKSGHRASNWDDLQEAGSQQLRTPAVVCNVYRAMLVL